MTSSGVKLLRDIANDLAFEKYLKKLHEERERARAYAAQKDKEKNAYDKKTCDC